MDIRKYKHLNIIKSLNKLSTNKKSDHPNMGIVIQLLCQQPILKPN